MGLFATLPFDRGTKTVEEALTLLKKKLAQLPGRGPYSLCEVRPDDNDHQWLRQWASCLQMGTVYQMGWQTGGLALLLIAETARRDAQEGHLWPVMQERFEGTVQGRFFVQGQPTREFKELLEQAARKLNLRHVFGREGKQEWYDSIYLQFGFTRNGMLSNLSSWLAGLPLTEAITYLRDSEEGSSSFQQLWSTLRNYRRDFLTKEQTRDVIRSSPWVLPSWEDDLLRLCKGASVSRNGERLPGRAVGGGSLFFPSRTPVEVGSARRAPVCL